MLVKFPKDREYYVKKISLWVGTILAWLLVTAFAGGVLYLLMFTIKKIVGLF